MYAARDDQSATLHGEKTRAFDPSREVHLHRDGVVAGAFRRERHA